MTGAILRRLREAAGIPRKALVAHGAQAAMVASLEDCGVSRAKPEHWERKRASWCRYLDALRAAKRRRLPPNRRRQPRTHPGRIRYLLRKISRRRKRLRPHLGNPHQMR